MNAYCKAVRWSRNRGSTPAEGAFSKRLRSGRGTRSHGWTTFHLQPMRYCSTFAHYPIPPTLGRSELNSRRSITSMPSRAISRLSTDFDTSPYPLCTFHRPFGLRYSRLFDTPSHDCPSTAAGSRFARSSLLSIAFQTSITSTSVIHGATIWMTSPLFPFLVY